MKPVNITMQNPNPLFTKGTVLNANLNSSPQQCYNAFSYAIQIVFTGTPTGTFSLQGSADPFDSGIPGYPANWTTIADTSTSVTAAGSLMYNVQEPAYNWVRVQYTDTSGGSSTAIMTVCTFNSKGF